MGILEESNKIHRKHLGQCLAKVSSECRLPLLHVTIAKSYYVLTLGSKAAHIAQSNSNEKMVKSKSLGPQASRFCNKRGELLQRGQKRSK